MDSLMRLKNKVAMVTGAASGIGKEIAVIFAREGAKVAIADLRQEAADATAREIDPSGMRAIGVAMDVANEEQVEAATARIIQQFGALDILTVDQPSDPEERTRRCCSPDGCGSVGLDRVCDGRQQPRRTAGIVIVGGWRRGGR